MRKVALFALLAVASSANAQIIRSRIPYGRTPNAWFSIGAGVQDGWDVNTPSGGWQLGNSVDFNASIEKPIGTQATIGIEGTTSRVPATVYDFDTYDPRDYARVSRAFVVLHLSPGSAQFHTVLNVKGGATFYAFDHSSSFDDTDFTFALGYGFGYNFSPRFSIDVVQDRTTMIHQRDGLPASTDTNSRVTTTRLVGRLGLGG